MSTALLAVLVLRKMITSMNVEPVNIFLHHPALEVRKAVVPIMLPGHLVELTRNVMVVVTVQAFVTVLLDLVVMDATSNPLVVNRPVTQIPMIAMELTALLGQIM